MKKKLCFLLLGVIGFASAMNAQQLNGVPANSVTATNTVTITGGTVSAAPGNQYATYTGTAVVSPGSQVVLQGTILSLNSIVTFLGQQYAIVPTPAVGSNDDLVGLFNTQTIPGVYPADVLINIGGGILIPFGTTAGIPGSNVDYTLVAVPFDFGLSAVLGAGAIAAVKTARRRRKEAQLVA